MKYGIYVDGNWRAPSTERWAADCNPARPADVLGEFAEAGVADVEEAVAAARDAFPGWSRTPAPERGRVLGRAAELLRSREVEFAEGITREEGKTLREARGEVQKAINVLEFYSGEGWRLGGDTLPSALPGNFTYTLRRPLGVAALVTPWNFPLAIPVWKVAPCLVAGNTAVWKPASATPWTACWFVELLAECGLPPGVLNLVTGSGSVVGSALAASREIQALSFTGSTSTGRALQRAVADRSVKLSLEMGGKNATVVLDDASLEAAVAGVVDAAFGSAGCRCTATSRVVVERGILPRFMEVFVDRVQRLRVGDGVESGTDVGPLIDEGQQKTVLNYVRSGVEEGARLLAGGRAPAGRPGFFVEPTVFDGVHPRMRIAQEEIFGPFVAVTAVDDLDEAIRVVNAVPYGLSASVYTESLRSAMAFVDGAEVGMVHVNSPTVGSEAQLPFGGVKDSGLGDREMGHEGALFFTNLQTVFVDWSDRVGLVGFY